MGHIEHLIESHQECGALFGPKDLSLGVTRMGFAPGETYVPPAWLGATSGPLFALTRAVAVVFFTRLLWTLMPPAFRSEGAQGDCAMHDAESPANLSGAQDLARGFNAFGLRLYRELGEGGNCFFSPLSISMAISALVPGARGATREELEGVLGLRGLNGPVQESASALLQSLLVRRGTEWDWSDPGAERQEVERDLFTLNIATALFVQEAFPILASYRDTVTDHFRAELFSLDFKAAAEAAGRINGWVSEQTQGKIPTLVSSEGLDPLTRFVLANAVYFKAAWSEPFEEFSTSPEPFFLLSEGGVWTRSRSR